MLRALSTAASGMEAQQTKLDVTANNIANVSTAGFKKGRAEFADLMYQTLRAPGAATGAGTAAPSGLEVGLGTRVTTTQRTYSQGELRQTGNPLDVAIEGDGFFPVTMPSGETAYTRNGALQLDSEGRIVTSEGYAIGDELTVPPEATSINIAADGTVSAIVPGDPQPVEIGQLQVATFVNPAGLAAMGKTLFMETQASGTAVLGAPGENGAGGLMQGTLELSNVNVVEEMIDLISGQRAYEVNTRVIKAGDEMLAATANLR
ncbi:MAG: flagellar basal-body rod protein FlgG [Kofleriaceae bacterium]|jgi:flagellar basal-body rod protein FlgG|nr:flagellar basal-body rod protein FlgG [Kofleriaceae bacterium]MBP6840230.1 flagellar basal-body rod protein FlgG [Kofleriaceae bacterium]MBP9204774.1 flagellar basal-body rod protein FlgG [Kofleriaceae bacterium]